MDMHVIEDQVFEKAQKRYQDHCLDIVLMDAKGVYEGICAHKEAVILAMSSDAFSKLRGLNLKMSDFHFEMMEFEQVEPSRFFEHCSPLKTGSHKMSEFEYVDGYEENEHYALGTKSADSIKIRYCHAWLNPPHLTNYSIEDFESFNDALFPNGRDHLEIYRWKDNFCDDYFKWGKEWWGTGLWSVYDKTLGRFIIIGASQTD